MELRKRIEELELAIKEQEAEKKALEEAAKKAQEEAAKNALQEEAAKKAQEDEVKQEEEEDDDELVKRRLLELHMASLLGPVSWGQSPGASLNAWP